jgi:3-methyladenine DNA glycosylase AlkD
MLKNFCAHCAKDEESYIKSSISKALSEYARINPQEVRRFVLSMPFSSQTTQEILKNL